MGERNMAGYASKSSRPDFMQAFPGETRALAVMPGNGKFLGRVNQHDLIVVDTHLPESFLDEPG
jgi:hypothetical protein